MQLASNAAGWDRYGLSPIQKVVSAASSGFRNVDFQFFSLPPDSIWLSDGWREEADRLIDACAAHGVRLVQSHAPGGNPLATDDLDLHMSKTVRSLEICSRLGIPQTVVHPGATEGMTQQEFLDRNRDYYLRLVPDAERLGVMLLAENIGAPYDPHWAHDGAELRALVDHINQPVVQACWDTGHGNINTVDQYRSITDLGPTLRGLHVQDNIGFFDRGPMNANADLHTLPFLGTVNFDAVIQGLIDIAYPGYFTFEVGVPRAAGRAEFIHRDKPVTTLRQPPIDVCARMQQLLYDTGRAMLSSYGIFDG
jgi:sugar phosphate isomerase/epimerase